jgi:hypothetical protein
MDFVAQELKTTHNHVREAMLGATTRHKATDIWTKKYEVPAKAYEKLAKRRAHADAFAEMVATGPKSPQEAVDAAGGALANATAYAGANESLTGASMPGSEATAYSATPTPNPKKGPFESLLGGVSNAIGTAISTVDGVVDKADAAIDGDLGATSATPAKANTGFMGDTTPGAMVGALAGGYFAGPMGSIVGGLIGQGINKALTGVADQANQNGAQDVGSGIAGGVGRMIDGFFGGLSNAFGGAPENLMNETAKERREQSDRAGLNARGREVRSESKQFDRAVRSGKGGLW